MKNTLNNELKVKQTKSSKRIGSKNSLESD